jgi:hypothetical protein
MEHLNVQEMQMMIGRPWRVQVGKENIFLQ